MLAEILDARSLADQLGDLAFDVQLLVRLEVPPNQLDLDTFEHFESALVLHLAVLAARTAARGAGIQGARSIKRCGGRVGHAAGAVGATRARGLDGVNVANDGGAALRVEGWLRGGFAVAEAPVKQGVVDEGFKHGHERFLVVADDAHDGLARELVAAVDVADLHGESEHTCKTEGHALWVLFAVHGHFEAVAEVNVNHFARDAVQHQVGWVTVAKAEDVTDHGHYSQGPGVVGSTLEPGLRALALEPENTIEIFSSRVIHGVTEDFHLLHQCEIVIIRRHLEHDAMLDI